MKVGWMPDASTRQGTSAAQFARQRGDAAVVAHVAVDDRRFAGPDRVDDRRGIFLRLRDLDLLGRAVGFRLPLPAGDLLDAALRIFVERNAELLDQVLAALLDEVGRVLGESAPSSR